MKRQNRKKKSSVGKRLFAGGVALLVAVALVAPAGTSLAIAEESQEETVTEEETALDVIAESEEPTEEANPEPEDEEDGTTPADESGASLYAVPDAENGDDADEGGIVMLAEGETVTISDANSLSNALQNTSYSNGEILQLTANISTDSTLAVASGVDVTLDLNGYSITNNGSSSVITVSSGGTLTLTDDSAAGDGKITGGSAASGGGVYVSGSFIMVEGTISGNTATGSSSTDVVAGGGGVYVVSGGSFTMTGGSISNNTAKAAENVTVTGGGGICAGANTTITLSNCEVSYNAAYSAVGGGGIYTRGTLEVGAGTKVCANYLTAYVLGNNGDGGGIYMTLSGSNTTIHRGATISGNWCEGAGGGIYCYNGTVNIGEEDANASDAGNTQIIGNTSMHMGGGIGTSSGAVTLTNTEIYANQTKGSTDAESASTSSHGGGVYVYNNGSITVNEGTEIGDSGTVSVEVPVIGSDGSVTGYTNEARSKGNYAEKDGGGVYVASGSLSITGGDIQYNEAGVSGGGVYNSDTELIISGGTISNNTAGASGGGVYSHSETEMQNCEISGNTAALDGGGVYCEATTSLNQDSRIRSNTAGRNGGGVYSGSTSYVEDAVTTLNYCYVQENKALGTGAADTDTQEGTGNGGGIYSHLETDVSFAYIYSNQAANDGGGVYSDAMTKMTRTQTMYNEAGNDGGGIYSHGDTTVSESHVSSNDAIGDGGGLYSAADTTITNTEIQNNCTAGNGGGIYIDDSRLILTTDSESGVSDGLPTMITSDITGNRAGYDNSSKQQWIAGKNSHGGGVYIEPPESGRTAAGELDISGSVTIKNNQASSGTENVWLFTDTADQTITIASPGLTSAASSIGVSTEEVPTATSDVQFTTDEAAAGTDFYTDHATYFFSDKGYGIRADTDDPDGENGEYLELYLLPVDTTTVHGSVHPVGGTQGEAKNAKMGDVSTTGWWALVCLAGALLAAGVAVSRMGCRSKRN